MDLNQIVAGLWYENSHITEISAKCIRPSINEGASISFGFDIGYSKPMIVENKKYGRLRMITRVTIEYNDDNQTPDVIDLSMEGIFSCSVTLEDEQFLNMLNINGAAALYSIMRAKIETISGMIYETGKIALPMINIIQYYEEKSKEVKD